jgi:hypothetical protein
LRTTSGFAFGKAVADPNACSDTGAISGTKDCEQIFTFFAAISHGTGSYDAVLAADGS